MEKKIAIMLMMRKIHSLPYHPVGTCGVSIFNVGSSTKAMYTRALEMPEIIARIFFVQSIEIHIKNVPNQTISSVSKISNARRMHDVMEEWSVQMEKMNIGVHLLLF